jgi:hypothetical protein
MFLVVSGGSCLLHAVLYGVKLFAIINFNKILMWFSVLSISPSHCRMGKWFFFAAAAAGFFQQFASNIGRVW